LGNLHTITAAQIVSEMANPLEVVVNIVYLIKQERHNPNEVLKLTLLAESQLECLCQIAHRELPSFLPLDGGRPLMKQTT
jgi:hypothetical protein